MPVPAIAQGIVTPTQRLLEWGQCLPDAKTPVAVAVGRMYRGNSRDQVQMLSNRTSCYLVYPRCIHQLKAWMLRFGSAFTHDLTMGGCDPS